MYYSVQSLTVVTLEHALNKGSKQLPYFTQPGPIDALLSCGLNKRSKQLP